MPGPAPAVRWRDRPARWLATRSLRGQLITGLVTLLALACAGVGLVTYIVISHTLLNQLDYQLQAAGGRYASCIEEKHHEGPLPPQGAAAANCNKTPGLNAGTFGARVKDGVVTDQGIIDGQSHLSAADQAMLVRLPPDGRYYTMDLGSLHGDYRLTAIKGLDGDVLITGLPLSPMESTLHKVEIAELTAFLAALVLAGFSAPVSCGCRCGRCAGSRPPPPGSPSCRWPAARSRCPSGSRTPARGPRPARSPRRSTGCSATSSRPWAAGRPARPGCAGSPPTPATSCAPRWPPSAATPSSRCAIRTRTAPTSTTPCAGSNRNPSG